MKQQFIVARNAFVVSVPDDGLPAWEILKPRFSHFAAASAESPVLEVDVQCRPLPVCDAEKIYEPVHAGIDIITSRASRLPDGCIIMEFKHVAETKPRVWMKMPPALNTADIVIAPDGDDNDQYFLTHALMIAFMLSTCINGTLMIHASAVMFGGKVYLFQGKSGTGKSTHARLWTQNIAGAELLNDDNPVIRFSSNGAAMAYGSPWSGKTHCYHNASAPIGAFVRIVRDEVNTLRRLAPLNAYASLTTSVSFLPFLGDESREMRHKTIERLVGAVPCCAMHCRPDADAAITCMRGVSLYSNNQN